MFARTAQTRRLPRALKFLCLAAPVALSLLLPVTGVQGEAFARTRRKVKTVKKIVTPPPETNSKVVIAPELLAADSLMRKGQFSDAESLYYQVLKNDPQSIPAAVGYGLALARQFKLEGARTQFEKVLDMDRSNAMAHAGLAIVLYNSLQSSDPAVQANREKILGNAKEECRKALAIDQNMPEAQFTLGNLHRTAGDQQEALKAYQAAIEIDPNYSEALAGIGLVELGDGKFEEAKSSFQKAIDANANNSTAHYGLGKTLYKLGNLESALKELNTSLSLHTESAPGHLTRGWVHTGLGHFEEALADFKESLRIKPGNSVAYLGIAKVKENQEELTAAIEELEEAQKSATNKNSLKERQALLYLKQGKLDAALSHYADVIPSSQKPGKAASGMAIVLYLRALSDHEGLFLASEDFSNARNLIQKTARAKDANALTEYAASIADTISGDTSRKITAPKENQKNSSYWEGVAYCQALLSRGKFKESENSLKTLIEKTQDTDSLMEIADLALVIRDLKNAKEAYEKAGKSSNAEAFQGRIDRGQKLIKESLEISRKETEKATQLAKEKEIEEALKAYREALLRDPRSAETRLGLAEALEKLRPYQARTLKEAASHYTAYIALSPDLENKEVKAIQKKADKLETRAGKLALKEKAKSRSAKKSSSKKKKKK